MKKYTQAEIYSMGVNPSLGEVYPKGDYTGIHFNILSAYFEPGSVCEFGEFDFIVSMNTFIGRCDSATYYHLTDGSVMVRWEEYSGEPEGLPAYLNKAYPAGPTLDFAKMSFIDTASVIKMYQVGKTAQHPASTPTSVSRMKLF